MPGRSAHRRVPFVPHHTCRTCHVACSSTADPDAPGPAPVQSAEEVGEIWQQLTLLKRQLNVAVAQESFTQAADLRDKVKALSSSLPPVQQYLYSQLEKLRSGSPQDRIAAIAALGAAGDEACLPELALCLRDPALQDAAHTSMWSVFTRCRDPRVNELMAEAEPLLHAGTEPQLERALRLYSEVVRVQPAFAEGFNKRATVLFLMHRYQDAIEDCQMVLQLNPYHFGAASGMGLCHWSLKQPGAALKAFQLALDIHPGLNVIRRHIETLQEEVSKGGQCRDEGSGDG